MEQTTDAVEETATESSGTTPQSQEQVPLHEADDADIEAYLQNALKEEKEEVAVEDAPPADESSEPQKEADQTEETPEAKEAPPADVTTLQKQIAELTEKNRKLETEADSRELFVKRRSQELGDLKKQLREAQSKLKEGIDELAIESPAKAIDRLQKVQKIDEQIEGIDQEQTEITRVHEAAKTFAKHVKPDEVTIDDMVQSLAEDKIDPHFIQAFRQNPFKVASADSLIQMAKRAKAEKALRSLVPLVKNLVEENKKLKAKPQEVLKKVNEAARQVPGVTAARGNSAAVTRTVAADPTSMSDAQIEEFLAAQR